MRILFVSELLEEISGAGIVSRFHLELIKRIVGIDDTYVVSIRDGKEEVQGNHVCFSFPKKRKEKLKRFLQGNPLKICNRIINEILQIIKQKEIDVVFIDDSIFGRLVKRIKKEFENVVVVSFYVDVKAELYNTWLKERGLKYLPWVMVGKVGERINAKYSTANIVLNEREAALFQKHYNKQPELILPVIVKNPGRPQIKTVKEKPVILFVGAYYKPNIDGFQWMVENVLPSLNIDFELIVIGKGMEKLKQFFETKDSRIRIIGSVDDVGPYYVQADIVVAPIFEGGGMKVKTAEAFSYGKLFVGTQESLEGYEKSIPDSFWGEYIFKCKTSEDFIISLERCFEIVKDYNNYKDLIYDIYYRNYSEDVIEREIKGFLL